MRIQPNIFVSSTPVKQSTPISRPLLTPLTFGKAKPVQEEYPLVIVGGGLSGMTAAYLAGKQGLETLVLESTERLGGNAKTGYKTLGGVRTPFPVGASVLAVANEEQRQLFTELGINVSDPRYKIHTDVAYFDGQWVSIDPDVKQKSRWAKRFVQGANDFIERLRTILNPTPDATIFPVKKMPASVFEWDKISMKTYLEQFPEKVRQFFETNLRSDISEDMENISALAGIIDQGADQGERCVLPGGNFYLIKQMKKKVSTLKSVTTQKDSPVVKIEESENGAVVHYKDPKSGEIKTVRGQNVLLAMPSHKIPDVVTLPAESAQFLRDIKRGAYAMLNIYVSQSPVQSNTYFKFPYAKWTADAILTNVKGDPELKPGSQVPGVITCYVGIPRSLEKEVPEDKKAFVKQIIDEMAVAWPWLKDKGMVLGHRLTMYPDAMSAPSPGQMTKIRDFNTQITPHVRIIHSDLSGVFAARGAIDEAFSAMKTLKQKPKAQFA